MTKKYIIDTNILLEFPEIIKELECVVLSHVLREIEKHKLSSNSVLAYQARESTRFIDQNLSCVKFDFKDYEVTIDSTLDKSYTDNKIIQACIDNGYGVISNDLLLKHKAIAYGIEVYNIQEYLFNQEEYKGYKEVQLNENELAQFYENLNSNTYDLLTNQYIIIKNEKNDFIETAKWNGKEIILTRQKGFSTNMFGKFKPYDPYQICALDSLMNNQMTMIKGKAGSGKSLIALNYTWNQIEKGKFSKLIMFVNPVASRNSSRLGFYPGIRTEKLLDSSVGSMLESKFGDMAHVESLINGGKILLLPFADIRGFDSTGMNAIIYFVESQNLDIELMKLGIQRIGDDCKAIIDGDYDSQVDLSAYEGSRNGMKRVSEVFRGREIYGEVKLPIIYRSSLAQLGDLL